MKNFSLLLIVLFVFINAYSLKAQTVTVIYIQGDVKTIIKFSNNGVWAEKTINLAYGPVNESQPLILTNNAVVKLIKDNGLQCEVNVAGTYNIKELKFEKIEEKSTLTSFLDYFKSFFIAHPNSESKEYYSNSIAAISKGEMVMPPLLSFPFPGMLPLLEKEMNFSWEVSCDTCIFELIIQDLGSKEIILQEEIAQHNFTLKNPEKYFAINKKYLWYVGVKNSQIKSVSQLFTISDPKEYKSKVMDLEKTFSVDNTYLTSASKMIGVFSALEKEKLINYMILYGQEQLKKYPRDPSIKDIYNRVYYDNLKRRRI